MAGCAMRPGAFLGSPGSLWRAMGASGARFARRFRRRLRGSWSTGGSASALFSLSGGAHPPLPLFFRQSACFSVLWLARFARSPLSAYIALVAI